jgi:hypothetical protein
MNVRTIVINKTIVFVQKWETIWELFFRKFMTSYTPPSHSLPLRDNASNKRNSERHLYNNKNNNTGVQKGGGDKWGDERSHLWMFD